MNGIFSYLKSYVILFLVLTILLEMVPKAGMQKYIRFFSEYRRKGDSFSFMV